MPIDPAHFQAHLDALHDEVAGLGQSLDAVAELQREAAFQELLDTLLPVLGALVRHQARGGAQAATAVVEELDQALERIGLRRVAERGVRLELWPEQAERNIELDREVLPNSSMVRVEILASGWARGEKVLVRPVGRVLEVVK